jgi:tetratricopeptide (TPR) repeat protein
MLAAVCRIQGDLDSAIAAGRQAREMAVELGDHALQVATSHRLGQAYYAIGNFGLVAELLRRSLEALEPGTPAPSSYYAIASQAWLALVLSAFGAFVEATCYGEEALRQLGALHADAAPTDAEQAEAYYRQALGLAYELGMRPRLAHCHLGLARLYLMMGRRERARAELASAIELYRSIGMTFWLPQAEAALAQVEGRSWTFTSCLTTC